MGKKSSYPSYSAGAVKVNGQTVATSSKKGNTVTTNYNMSEAEKDYQKKVQNGMSTSLDNLFEISEPQKELWNKQLDALKAKGIENINEIYTPMETSLKNDIASRFGNLDNSIFMDKLNNITNQKSKAVAELSSDLLSTQDSLYANELVNKMNLVTLLNNLNSSINNNILNYTSAASANSSSGNNYNNNAYMAQQNNLLNSILNKTASSSSSALANYGLSFLS